MKKWELINRKLIAKGLAELSYEEIVQPVEIRPGNYQLALEGGVTYEFRAWRTIWDFLRVDPLSITRCPALNYIRADQFYLDTQKQHQMSPTTLANFLEELYRTQWSDLKSLELQETYHDYNLFELDETALQSLLEGHPKALVNKGRIGWSTEDLNLFAPESAQDIRLHWLAVRKTLAEEEYADELDALTRLRLTMSEPKAKGLTEAFYALDLQHEDYTLIPCHPWQWKEVLEFHFQNELQSRDIIELGVFGDFYQPQTSLRTLSNQDDPTLLQIKLPVSILNTSCVRGIDGKYIPIAPRLSKILKDLSADDVELKDLVILGDVSGSFVPHSAYQQIIDAPYRFQEFLGCIWRQSPQTLLEADEKALLTAALFHRPLNQKALISQAIERSGLNAESWLSEYFRKIVVPLYHLQLKYGIGLVAHGQNIMLSLRDYRPSRLIIKDFQGDLRLLDEDIPELECFSDKLKASLTRLPAPYLIHDLLTGHFVTVLRFISAALFEDLGFAERNFYALLADEIRRYHERFPQHRERANALGILKPTIPRVLVNKVRFHIGYGDSALRPLPMVGTPLKNPLYEESHV